MRAVLHALVTRLSLYLDHRLSMSRDGPDVTELVVVLDREGPLAARLVGSASPPAWSARERLPVLALARVQGLAAAAARVVGSLGRALAVHAAEEASSHGPEAGEAAGRDANVALDDGPDADVARVPQPVAQLAVVDEEAHLDHGGDAGEDAQSQDGHQSRAPLPAGVEPPQHGPRDDDGEAQICEDVEANVGVGKSVERVGGPAARCNRRVPEDANILTLENDSLGGTK